jgi:hypothetical protein
MTFEHLIITRFCIRNPGLFRRAQKKPFHLENDPWNSKYFIRRIKLLRMTSGAGILGQTTPDFYWIIVTDPELPQKFRDLIRNYFGLAKRLIIHDYSGSDMFQNAEWIKQYFVKEPDYLLTTILDDDDILSSDFVRNIRKKVTDEISPKSPPLLRMYGTTAIKQWNLIPSKAFPLGSLSDWHGRHQFPNTGMSLLVKYPEISLTVSRLSHAFAKNYFDFSQDPIHTYVTEVRDLVIRQLESSNIEWAQHLNKPFFTDLSGNNCKVVMTNHLNNSQLNRLYERKLNRIRISEANDLNGFSVNLEEVKKEIGFFKIDSIHFWRAKLRRIKLYLSKLKKSIISRMK